MSAALELQTRVVAKLSGIATTFNIVPEDQDFPYFVYEPRSEEEFGTDTVSGERHRFAVHIYSTYQGSREVHQFASQIRTTLDGDGPAVMTASRLVGIFYQTTEITMEDINRVHHGVVFFGAITEEAN